MGKCESWVFLKLRTAIFFLYPAKIHFHRKTVPQACNLYHVMSSGGGKFSLSTGKTARFDSQKLTDPFRHIFLYIAAFTPFYIPHTPCSVIDLHKIFRQVTRRLPLSLNTSFEFHIFSKTIAYTSQKYQVSFLDSKQRLCYHFP